MTTERPMHGDVWRSPVACRNFSVMYVCGHHDPPHVTGYWWRGESLDPDLHDSIPLPRFLSSMELIEREFPSALDQTGLRENRRMAKCDYCGKALCPTCHQHKTAEKKTADMRDALTLANKLLEDADVKVDRQAQAQIDRALEHGF